MTLRFWAGTILFTVLWSLVLTLTPLQSRSAPQVKGAQTPVATFKHSEGTPNPNEILRIINQVRINSGLQPLVGDEQLQDIAATRVKDMVSRQYYAHQNPDGKYYYDIFKDQNIPTDNSCENLDINFTVEALPYVKDWLNSNSGHRECLLNPNVTSAGYAVAKLSDVMNGNKQSEAFMVVAIHARVR